MKMKNRMEKMMCCLMAFLIALSNSTGIAKAEVVEPKAYNGVLSIDTSVGWEFGGTSYGQAGYTTMNGENVYCIERLVTTHDGARYVGVEEDFTPAGITHAMKEKMSLLAYFVKKRANETGNVDWHSIVQSAIWAEQGQGAGWVRSATFNLNVRNSPIF